MGTGVIIGRFQTDILHDGYMHLFREVQKVSTKVVVIIGESPTRLTDRHPLTAEMRGKMILESFPEFEIASIMDHSNDDHWVRNLEDMLLDYENVTLYGSRDSFLDVYRGKYPTVYIETPVPTSSTERRLELMQNPPDDQQFFRSGMIYASKFRFPVAYPTVDIIVLNEEGTKIILGRKRGEILWRMPGGFVDPSDESMEEAALRELSEEMINIQPKNLKYFKSFKVRDWRYKNTSDSIMTTVFSCTSLIIPEPGDDLEELRVFDFNKQTIEENVLPEHKRILIEYEKEFNN